MLYSAYTLLRSEIIEEGDLIVYNLSHDFWHYMPRRRILCRIEFEILA